MDGRWAFEDRLQLFGIPLGDSLGVQRLAEPIGQQLRAVEGALHRELLVEEHPDQQCQPVACQQTIGLL